MFGYKGVCGGVWLQARECVCLVFKVCVVVCGYKHVSVCVFGYKGVCGGVYVGGGYKHVSVCVWL